MFKLGLKLIIQLSYQKLEKSKLQNIKPAPPIENMALKSKNRINHILNFF